MSYSIFGQIGPAPCQCNAGRAAYWFIKADGLHCSNCGRVRTMSVPPQGMVTSPCQCELGSGAVWFITANGNYSCSYCGRER